VEKHAEQLDFPMMRSNLYANLTLQEPVIRLALPIELEGRSA
jgi:hypothetical protein